MSRLHHAMAQLGERFVWRTWWRKARELDMASGGDGFNAPRWSGPGAAEALSCLEARERAREDEEHRAPHPCRPPAFSRHRLGSSGRALKRRGWTHEQITRAMHAGTLVADADAAAAIRADRRPGS